MIVGFSYNLIVCRCIAFNVVAISVEVNTFFLHTRKLLQLYGYPFTGLLYRSNAVANLLTFIVFRFGPLSYMFYGIFNWGHRVTTLYYYMIVPTVSGMALINIGLFGQLLNNDVFRSFKKPGAYISSPSTSNGLEQNGKHCSNYSKNPNLNSFVNNDKTLFSNNNHNHAKQN